MNSDIKQFYSNAHVLITGGTGLFGKVLVQKLLRSCSDISYLYLIIRSKKGKSGNDRKSDLFTDIIFDKMKETVPNYLDKIIVLEGDTSKVNLGLSSFDQHLIKEKVNIVFHCAASMSMDAKLKDAIGTNVRGLYELINLCQEINKLKSFLFVSTAYSCCIHHVVDEKFYEPPIEAKTLMKFTEGLSENILENIKASLIGEWPNPYCFSKAMAENIFQKEGKNLPIGVFRPSIVMPIYEDPYPGWTSNVYGPIGVMLASGLGIIRIFLCNSNLQCDMVPVDYCINSLICTAWDTYNQRINDKEMGMKTEIPIYNYSSGPDRHITWGDHITYSLQYKYPFKKALWATMLLQIKNKYLYYFLWILLHTIPALAMDSYLTLRGKKTRMIRTYKKIYKFSKVLSYFSTREWKIMNKNVKKLWYKLNKNDQTLFPFDMDTVDHKKLVSDACTGMKIYILKEDLNNVEEEIKHYKRLVFLHNSVKYGFQIAILVVLFRIIFMLCN
ncbi:hypothetical protein FQR65_LT04078 [Abscondita terminalis]|nr:hypothetical protein FQR65_LT04078 [Abscondita terminalis]